MASFFGVTDPRAAAFEEAVFGEDAATRGRASRTQEAIRNDPRKAIREQAQAQFEQSQDLLQQQLIPPELRQALMGAALGQAPSAAEIQGRQQLAQLQRQMLGGAAGAQGVSPALALRQALQAGGQAGLEAIGQSQALRAQEMAAARQAALGGVFGERELQLQPFLGLQQLGMGGLQTLEQSRAQAAAAREARPSVGGQIAGATLTGFAGGLTKKLFE